MRRIGEEWEVGRDGGEMGGEGHYWILDPSAALTLTAEDAKHSSSPGLSSRANRPTALAFYSEYKNIIKTVLSKALQNYTLTYH